MIYLITIILLIFLLFSLCKISGNCSMKEEEQQRKHKLKLKTDMFEVKSNPEEKEKL